MDWISIFTILGGVGAMLTIFVTILVQAFSKLDQDIKSAIGRIDAAHSRIDSMGTRIDAVHNVIIDMLRSKTG